MTDENDSADVIPLHPTVGIRRGASKSRPRSRGCFHPTKLLDESARVVECENCGAVLDAFDVLNDLVRKNDAVIYQRVDRRRLAAEEAAYRHAIKSCRSALRRPLSKAGFTKLWVEQFLQEIKAIVNAKFSEEWAKEARRQWPPPKAEEGCT